MPRNGTKINQIKPVFSDRSCVWEQFVYKHFQSFSCMFRVMFLWLFTGKRKRKQCLRIYDCKVYTLDSLRTSWKNVEIISDHFLFFFQAGMCSFWLINVICILSQTKGKMDKKRSCLAVADECVQWCANTVSVKLLSLGFVCTGKA